MKSLLKFIITYHFFILFLLLEAFAFFLLVQNNSYQRAGFINSANFITGVIYEKFYTVTHYLSLKETNEQLQAENTYLYNRLKSSSRDNRIVFKEVKDSSSMQQYVYTYANVINNSINKQNNYITLDRGAMQGIQPDMGVISPSGLVGVVKNVSDNFSLVISVLNSNLKISAKVKRSGYFGSLSWDGKDSRFAILNEIPFHVKIHRGDTIITSGYSAIFPEGIPLGVIDAYNAGEGNSFYFIRVKLATDFNALSSVYIITNLLKNEQTKLEKESAND